MEHPAPPQYAEAAERSGRRQMRSDGADVLFQPTFHARPTAHTAGFIGFADFIIRNTAGEYEVYDTKLARHAKIGALLQLAGYAEQMEALGIPIGDRVHLVLGEARRAVTICATSCRCTDAARGSRVLAERVATDRRSSGAMSGFSGVRPVRSLLREVRSHRDLVLVAGMRLEQRTRLIRRAS